MKVYATSGSLECRVTLEVKQDIPSNCSQLKLTQVAFRDRNLTTMYAAWCTGTVTVNGKVLKEFVLTDTVGYAVDLNAEWDGLSCSNCKTEIYHAQDGTASVSIRLNLALRSRASSTYIGGFGQTLTATLPRIPRVSGILAEGVTLGQQMTVSLSRAAESFRDTLEWICGGERGVLAENSAGTVFSWTPPVTLAAQNPAGAAVSIVLRVTTYVSGQAVGTRDLTVSCPIPEDVIPTLAVAVTDAMGYAQDCGGYVQNQSQARVVTQAAGVYGSEICQISVQCGGVRTTGEDVTLGLGSSGAVTITVTATDSRGRTASAESTITVLPYENPGVTIRQAYRCDASGQPQADGAYLKLVFDAQLTALPGSSAAYQAAYQVHGGGESWQIPLPEYAGQFSPEGASVVLPAGIDSGYDCRILAEDRFGQGESLTVLVPVAFLLLDFSRQTRAAGIGMRAKNPEKLSIGLDTDMGEHRIGNLAAPESDTDAATKAYVDSRIQQLMAQLNLTT